MLLGRDWEYYFPKNKQMGDITWLPMVAEPSLLMKTTIILPNLRVPGAEMGHYRTLQGILAVLTLLSQN